MSTLSMRGLSKVYPGGVRAVEAVDLQVSDGEFVVLVGPSGCGKSTLLRMIAGLEEASAGELLIDDRAVTHMAARDRDVAMVFQNYALYPHLDVRRNLAFGLMNRRRHGGLRSLLFPGARAARRAETARIHERVDGAAELLGLGALMDRKPGQLSGGQRQRVALGRALVREPRVFLFDEPLSNLDAKLRHEMRTELRLLHRRLRATMIYVTHDQEEAMSLGDRIVVMRDGRVQQIGSPIEVYRSPANRFVAGFVGTPAMNFAHGSVRSSGNRVAFEQSGIEIQCPSTRISGAAPPGAPPSPAVLGVRPESLRLVRDGAASIPAQVEAVEHLGDRADVALRTPLGRWIARIASADAPEEGAETKIALDVDAVHFFRIDAEGARW